MNCVLESRGKAPCRSGHTEDAQVVYTEVKHAEKGPGRRPNPCRGRHGPEWAGSPERHVGSCLGSMAAASM